MYFMAIWCMLVVRFFNNISWDEGFIEVFNVVFVYGSFDFGYGGDKGVYFPTISGSYLWCLRAMASLGNLSCNM